MATRRTNDDQPSRRRPPSTSPEAHESKMISLAMDLAEKRLRDGTASAQEVTHWLKAGSSRERLEKERLRHENELLKAKREALASQARVEELYKSALNAMRTYAGQDPMEFDDFDD